MVISISIRGAGGAGKATFEEAAWNGMRAVERVLAIHEQRRDLTQGKPFDVARPALYMGARPKCSRCGQPYEPVQCGC